MTLRTKTLTAVAALTLSASGFAWAQEATSPAPTEQAAEAQATTEDTAADATEAPAEDSAAPEAAEESAADEAPQADEADAAPDAEAEAEEPAEATEDATAAEETPAAEAEAEAEAPAEEAAEAHADDHGDDAHGDDAHGDDAHGEEGDHGGGHGAVHIEDIDFSFEGPFGKFDQFQLQRGLQVYTEVCSACHGMKFVPIRTLHDEGGPGLPEDQVRAYAASLTEITDAETGEDRTRLPTDHFPAVSGDGMGPDLSLMAKARAGFHGPYGTGLNQLINGIGGPEYIHAILTSYTGEEMEQAGSVFYENTAFPSGYIAMPPPLSDDLVTYEDGTPATVDQMARDLSAFLMWTAEPKMMDRKMVGLVSVLFLIVLGSLLYLTNKRIWAPHKGKKA
ncbi:cytochrome c1 [Paracoccus homiensis]|uniref:Cytochrome c1 n=1 Tax=Paracoccus homiensis TaxID=364199 RepID=A0A1H9Z0T6_9RHOB|nr:cytochrome c1 [Paracoccus homiensis]SES74975.1 ubiquinol-cytochrome c reductase cytochrome c1 subunit [Paracoccus homiensis]